MEKISSVPQPKLDMEYIEKRLTTFHFPNDTLREMGRRLNDEMNKAAASDEGAHNTVKMLPTFVRHLPNQQETGNYLALDLGGTKFRVLLITLNGINFQMTSDVFEIPQSIMIGPGKDLFDHIAHCLSEFMKRLKISDQKLSLGFTFSFPCAQDALASGRLINWTKGFKCSDVEGHDVVKLLQDAVHRRKEIDVNIAALLNDTVGTLMSMAHSDPYCRIGVIVGTGTNACYLEKLSKCPKLSKYQKYEDDEMVINVEWGAFGDNGALDFMLTAFDEMIDKRSINPGQQRFEKAISGMYLGELVRLVLVDLYKNAGLFQNDTENAKSLLKPHSFLTKYVSTIEKDNLEHSEEFPKTRKVLAAYFNITKISKVECEVIARTGRALARRSANMCAAAVVTLINRMNLPMVNIGCDGSVYKLHPTYKTFLESKIEDLLDSTINRFTLKLSEDGSGRGAALVAAVASTPHRSHHRKRVLKAVEKKARMSPATKRLHAELEQGSSAVDLTSLSSASSAASERSLGGSLRDDSSEKAPKKPVNARATAECKIS